MADARQCSKCRELKSLIDFYREAKDPLGRQRTCKKCISAYAKARKVENPRRIRDQYLKREYGISLERYEQIADGQDWRCAICGRTARLHVDHDHETGRVRGLLCGECNRGIGLFKDDVDSLKMAIEYLKKRG